MPTFNKSSPRVEYQTNLISLISSLNARTNLMYVSIPTPHAPEIKRRNDQDYRNFLKNHSNMSTGYYDTSVPSFGIYHDYLRENISIYLPLYEMARVELFKKNIEDFTHSQCILVNPKSCEIKSPASGDCRDMISLNMVWQWVHYLLHKSPIPSPPPFPDR